MTNVDSLDSNALQKMLLHYEIEQFLIKEASLLDALDLKAWLGLLTGDILYSCPVRDNRFRRNKQNKERDQAYLFHDDRVDLEQRVARMETGLVWAEDPRSRMTRAVSNVSVMPGDQEDEITVTSLVTVHCCRREDEEFILVASREDNLRRSETGWQIAKRHAVLEHNTFSSGNLNFFV